MLLTQLRAVNIARSPSLPTETGHSSTRGWTAAYATNYIANRASEILVVCSTKLIFTSRDEKRSRFSAFAQICIVD
jgi:hypothetical protein